MKKWNMYFTGTLNLKNALVVANKERTYFKESDILHGTWYFFTQISNNEVEKIYLRHEAHAVAGVYELQSNYSLLAPTLFFYDKTAYPKTMHTLRAASSPLYAFMGEDAMFYHTGSAHEYIVHYKRKEGKIVSISLEPR
jgi:hypothetical protein